ncbi:ATP-binding protein [Sulfurimonas gotlandica]|uniref:ATP-binding protein n=1 Tax=Sulfurimonas gotlandica TaxID=1176482 RepID=UPI0002D91C8F|nr:transporter substrate-binding domain-containing protein [Sulfurimonas gotlandica]
MAQIPLHLTQEEQVWIKEHKTVRVAAGSHSAPIEFRDENGKYHGISIDYLKHIEASTGITFEIVSKSSWDKDLELLRDKKISMISSTRNTQEGEEVALFSKPYLSMPINIFARNDSSYISNLNKLNGKRVAVEKGYSLAKLLKRDYPKIIQVSVSSNKQALKMIIDGDVDAYIGNVSTVTYNILKLHITNVNIVGETPYTWKRSMAVRKDLPLLNSIIQKALDLIELPEKDVMHNRWMTVHYEHEIDYIILFYYLGFVLLILFFAILWNISLKSRVAKRIHELEQHDEYYHSLFNNSIYAIAITGADFKFTHVNKEFCDLLGYDEKELINTFGILDVTYIEDLNYSKSMIDKLIRGASTKYKIKKRYLTKSAKVVDAVSFIHAIYDDNNTYIGATISILDISDKKHAQEEVLKHKSRLVELVAQRTQELSKANKLLAKAKESAELANKSKNIFISNMSHEIRTPMNAILGFSRLLSHTKLNNQQKTYLSRAKKATKSLLSLLEDTLDLSKIEAGKLTIENIPFQPKVIVTEITELLELNAKEKGLLIEYEIDEHLPKYLLGDPNRIKQVLINLINNAIKFTQDGSIYVSVFVNSKNIHNCCVEFVVSDTGIGIKKENLADIFEHFTQVDNSTTKKEDGTGLGLAISKELVKRMGGQIDVQSEYREGSTFSFELTLDISKAKSTSEISENNNNPHFKDIKTLLVEDNEDNLIIAIELLKFIGIEVDTARNGEIALEMIRKNNYDLVLMDIQMPIMDGLTATRILRKEGFIDLPIIAVSAYASAKEHHRSIGAGLNAHINKPFKLKEIQDIIFEYFPDKVIDATPVNQIELNWIPQLQQIDSLEFTDDLYSYWLNKESFLIALEKFLNNISKDREEIHNNYNENKLTKVLQLLHTLKGHLNLFGAKKLFNITQELELAIQSGDETMILRKFSEFDSVIDELK